MYAGGVQTVSLGCAENKKRQKLGFEIGGALGLLGMGWA